MSIDHYFAKHKIDICTSANKNVVRIPAQNGAAAYYRKQMAAQYNPWVQHEDTLLKHIHDSEHKLANADRQHVVLTKRCYEHKDASGNLHWVIETYDAGINLADWAATPVLIDGKQYASLFCHPSCFLQVFKGCIQALHAIHKQQILHLGIHASNICLPIVDSCAINQPFTIDFNLITLIDFGFSLWWLHAPLPKTIQLPLAAEANSYLSTSLIDALKSQRRLQNQFGQWQFDQRQLQALDYSCDLFALGHLFANLYDTCQSQRLAADASQWQLIDEQIQKIISNLVKFDTGLYGDYDQEALPHPFIIGQLQTQLGKLTPTNHSTNNPKASQKQLGIAKSKLPTSLNSNFNLNVNSSNNKSINKLTNLKQANSYKKTSPLVPQPQIVQAEAEDLEPFEHNGFYGFRHKYRANSVVMQPLYHKAWYFKNGLARVFKDGKYGFINLQGEPVIKFQYDDAEDFIDGLARVKINGKYGFINPQGEPLISFQYDDAGDFIDGLAKVKKDGKYGFINPQDELVYSSIDGFNDGLGVIEKNGKYGFIDQTGNQVITLQYDDTYGFSESLAAIRKGDEATGKWGFIDKIGNQVIALQYDDTEGFSEGLANVRKNDKWGFIDKTGKQVIALQYDYAGGG